MLQPSKNLESENASFGLARKREEEYLDIATNDAEVLWDPWSLLAHLDVEPPPLRYAALPRNPTDPLILNF